MRLLLWSVTLPVVSRSHDRCPVWTSDNVSSLLTFDNEETCSNICQGKSLSLICSALSWLRTHKKQQHEGTIAALKAGMEDEPDWMVEQMLRRKREELARRWKQREERLAQIRAKERELQARSSKRRRTEDRTSKRGSKAVNEDAEFLLDDWNDDEAGDDPLSIYSKETRALMESVGLGAPKKQEEEAEVEEEIKVYPGLSPAMAMAPR